ncbi:MAG TPA: class I SAM-dependent methyltransferase [Polyangiales bacterium]|jgi:methyltransferase (TIGR00027 family)|nr:class I SAM-dependent methyltransferase [Polyangiales bacterium]
MAPAPNTLPDNTAVRVALWRALHVLLDPKPHVLDDTVGLKLVAPEPGWEKRPDMDPLRTRTFRTSIVARARVIEDLVEESAQRGVSQYVLLGAGLDTFAQRRPELASRLQVFEVEQPGTQAWKRARLEELGFALPAWLHFVPVDFEAHESWLQKIELAGFDAKKPAVVASTGVAMYLTLEAITAMLKQVASLAPGSTFAMSFIRPLALVDPEERPGYEAAIRGAAANGTPFLSFFAPPEIVALARDAGFKDVKHLSAPVLTQRYFAGRPDGLRPSSGEELIVATT